MEKVQFFLLFLVFFFESKLAQFFLFVDLVWSYLFNWIVFYELFWPDSQSPWSQNHLNFLYIKIQRTQRLELNYISVSYVSGKLISFTVYTITNAISLFKWNVVYPPVFKFIIQFFLSQKLMDHSEINSICIDVYTRYRY